MMKEQLDGDRIFLLHGLLTPDECARLIMRSEDMTFERGTVGGEVVDDARNNERVLFDDVPLADDLFRRTSPHLPAVLEEQVLVGFNERWRFYRYDRGQTFRPHRDGAYIRFKERHESRLTFMVFLGDDLVGGQTRFFRSMAQAYANDPYVTVTPQAGMALVFEHRIWHEGAVVETGRKYVLRTDVMYGRPRRER